MNPAVDDHLDDQLHPSNQRPEQLEERPATFDVVTDVEGPVGWVRSLVRRSLAARLFPTGQVNWEVVDAAILAVEPVATYMTAEGSGAGATIRDPGNDPDAVTSVRLLLDSDNNAVVAERALLAAGTCVVRDASYEPYRPGHRGFRLIVQPAADSNGLWERDL